MTTDTDTQTQSPADQKAAQIIARSIWKLQNKDAATEENWAENKSQFNRMAQQTVSALKKRGFSISEDAS